MSIDNFTLYVSAPPRVQALRSREISSSACSGTGASIRAYALHLAADRSTTFAQNVENFISCTRESRETSPQVVMRNMRQFMSGMKNYLVKHGEREFEKEVEKERVKVNLLKSSVTQKKPFSFHSVYSLEETVCHIVCAILPSFFFLKFQMEHF